MKTAFLLYRPVMDYEESEKGQLIFTTRAKAKAAQKLILGWLESAADRFSKARQIEDEDARWDEMDRIEKSLGEPPLGWELDSRDYGRWSSFNKGCVAIRELPLNPE